MTVPMVPESLLKPDEMLRQLDALAAKGFRPGRIHSRTVRNFILSLEELNNKGKRDWIAKNLNDYFRALNRMAPGQLTWKISALLFNQYLPETGKYLYLYHRFFLISGLNWLLFGGLADLVLLFTGISGHYAYVPAGILLAGGIYQGISLVKKLQHRAYGLYY